MPAPLKWRKKAILGKIEPTYATDAVPTGAANAILTIFGSLTPLAANFLARDNVQPYPGSRQELVDGAHAVLEFEVEMAGAGAVDSAPAYGPLLRGCARSETITLTTGPVEYELIDAAEEALTFHVFEDGQKHALVGCRGNVEFRMNAKQIPVYHFMFTGIYVAPVSAANPTLTLTGFQLPRVFSDANTPTFTLHGYAGKLQSLIINQGNLVAHRDLVGEESIQITDRRMTGSIVIEEPPISTKDFFAIQKAATLGVLQVIHGTVAGNIVQHDAPQVQLKNIRRQEMDSVSMLAMDLVLAPTSAGNDEHVLTTK